MVDLIRQVNGGVCVSFDEATTTDMLADVIYQHWFARQQYTLIQPLDLAAFTPFTAAVQAREVGAWFGRVLHHSREVVKQ